MLEILAGLRECRFTAPEWIERYMQRLIRTGGVALVASALTAVALAALYVGASELMTHLYYAKRPILSAMHSARGLSSWTDDSQPSRAALLQKIPLGSNASNVTAALSAEGFACHSASSSGVDVVCSAEVPGSFGMRTFWSVRLNFDDASRLTDAKISLQTLWL